MSEKFIHQLPHNPVEPISLERGEGDTVIVNGIVFQADFFRAFKSELSDKVLYRIDKHGKYYIIRTLHDATKHFAPELLVEV